MVIPWRSPCLPLRWASAARPLQLFLFNGAACASAGYIMCKAMGGNEDIAAQAVCLSTALSAFTLMLGIFILKTFSLI